MSSVPDVTNVTEIVIGIPDIVTRAVYVSLSLMDSIKIILYKFGGNDVLAVANIYRQNKSPFRQEGSEWASQEGEYE